MNRNFFTGFQVEYINARGSMKRVHQCAETVFKFFICFMLGKSRTGRVHQGKEEKYNAGEK
jgi:hypothetical protein